MIGGGRPILHENLAEFHPPESADFRYVFALSASAVTPSKKFY